MGILIMSSSEFNKNYLREIIFRVEFRRISELHGVNGNPDKFINIFKSTFSEVVEIGELTQNLPPSFEKEVNLVWTFSNKDDSKRVELTSSSITLMYDGDYYVSHENMYDDLVLIKQALIEFDVHNINRIGLRYVNEISPKIDVNNWEGWINEKLINFNPIRDDFTLIRSMSTSEYKINDYFLDIRYGEFNYNYPDVSIGHDFVLDYDCYVSSLTEVDELIHRFNEMHSIIKKSFNSSIKEKLIEDLMEDE